MKLLKSGGKLHWIKNLYGRFKHGAGCCDRFSLCHFLAPRILRTLTAFRADNIPSHPGDVTYDEWLAELDEIIWAFNYLVDGEGVDDTDWSVEKSRRDGEREQRGLELFGRRFRTLWQ